MVDARIPDQTNELAHAVLVSNTSVIHVDAAYDLHYNKMGIGHLGVVMINSHDTLLSPLCVEAQAILDVV